MTTTRGVTERAFAEAVKSAPVKPEDAAAVALARRLVQLIDLERGEEGETLVVVKLAAELRQMLAQLGMTPLGRSAANGKAPAPTGEKPKSALQRSRDELAARRAEREAAGS